MVEEVYESCDSLVAGDGNPKWWVSNGSMKEGALPSTLSVDAGKIKVVARKDVWGVYVTLNSYHVPNKIITDLSTKPLVRLRIRSDKADPNAYITMGIHVYDNGSDKAFSFGNFSLETVESIVEVDIRKPNSGQDLTQVEGLWLVIDRGTGYLTADTTVWIDNITVDNGEALPLSATISPTEVTLAQGYSQEFKASVLGGTAPYTYSWRLNGLEVWTLPTYTYFADSLGSHLLELFATDALGAIAMPAPFAEITVIPLPPAPEPPLPLHVVGHQILKSTNAVFYPRIIGKPGDLDAGTGMWGGKGEDVFSYYNDSKWNNDPVKTSQRMNDTLYCMATFWKANMLRVQFDFNWWWLDNINARDYQGSGAPDVTVSNRTYFSLLAERCQANGMYLLFCGYALLDQYTASRSDSGGIPGQVTAAGKAFLDQVDPITNNEMTAWHNIWVSIASRLGQYKNVAFEIWNEPDNPTEALRNLYRSGACPNRDSFFAYSAVVYDAIRSVPQAADSLIFIGWTLGYVPGYNDCNWVKDLKNYLTAHLGHEPTNVVYVTHNYRHSPGNNTSWGTDYATVYSQIEAIVIQTRTGGIDVPLCCTESGVMLSGIPANEIELDLMWMDALMKVDKNFGIGFCDEYWMHLGQWPYDEAMIQTNMWPASAISPTPSRAGSIFISNAVNIFNLNIDATNTAIPFTIRKVI